MSPVRGKIILAPKPQAPHPGFWTVPRIWDGGECFILGGGPSLKGVDVSQLCGRRVIAVNQAYKLGAWDVLFFGDPGWWRDLGVKDLMDWSGLRVTAQKGLVFTPPMTGVRILERRPDEGINPNPRCLNWNLSSGACAINLAVHFGVRRIVLLGFDMKRAEDGACNWHEDYGKRHPKYNPYLTMLGKFDAIARDLERMGVECLNATEGSAIEVFPRVRLEEVLSTTPG